MGGSNSTTEELIAAFSESPEFEGLTPATVDGRGGMGACNAESLRCNGCLECHLEPGYYEKPEQK